MTTAAASTCSPRTEPLLAKLVVERTRRAASLTIYEQDFVEGLVLQAAVALENALYHERDLQWARVQQDLDAARSIQRSLLPKAMPEIPGVSVAAKTVTCYEVGGDYLDTSRCRTERTCWWWPMWRARGWRRRLWRRAFGRRCAR